jgi:hypothetical protein
MRREFCAVGAKPDAEILTRGSRSAVRPAQHSGTPSDHDKLALGRMMHEHSPEFDPEFNPKFDQTFIFGDHTGWRLLGRR